jgi:hypothetical protein
MTLISTHSERIRLRKSSSAIETTKIGLRFDRMSEFGPSRQLGPRVYAGDEG